MDWVCLHDTASAAGRRIEWSEGNFEDYEQDKVRRLGPDSVNPKGVTYKRLTR